MSARDENRPAGGEAGRMAECAKRPRSGNRDAVVLVQFTLTAVVEQAECRVAVLLNFGEHDAGADGMNRPGGDEDRIACRDGAPMKQVDDRPVPDRRMQFLRRDPVRQPDADLRAGFCRQDVPRLALAVAQPDGAREGIVRVNLYRQRLAGEQEFEQQTRSREHPCRHARTTILPRRLQYRRRCSRGGGRCFPRACARLARRHVQWPSFS